MSLLTVRIFDLVFAVTIHSFMHFRQHPSVQTDTRKLGG